MWTVLIVEDEVFVRESIREIIRWEDLGFQVVAEAGNGKEALKLIEQLTPDLVLTDIDMPELDGIELLKQTRDKGYECKFIMLTCMDEFEYVRQAMEYGASSYILKLSMSVQSLRDTLAKMARELSSHPYEALWEYLYSSTNSQSQIQDLIDNNVNKLYNKVSVISVLHGAVVFHPRELLDGWQWNTADFILHHCKIKGQTTLFIYTNFSVNEISKSKRIDYPISMSLNEQPEKLLQAWRKSLRGLDYHWYGQTNERTDYELQFLRDWDVLSWGLEKKLIQFFEFRNKDACEQTLELIWKELQEKWVPMPVVKEIAERIVSLCLRIVNRSTVHLTELEDQINHHELKRWIWRQLASVLAEPVELIDNDHPEIHKVLSFIQQNYNKDITVKQMAEYVNMGESYLSGLFKKKTGNNMIHYLHEVRIKHARQYLSETDLSNSVIAGKVGFANDNYFIKIFKRITNLTPNEYRKQFR